MFTNYDAERVSFQADVLSRMLAIVTEREECYSWPAPRAFTLPLSVITSEWREILSALVVEDAEEWQWEFEDDPADWLHRRPGSVVDGKVVPELLQERDRNGLLLLSKVTPELLLQVVNEAAKAATELLREELFSLVDAPDNYCGDRLAQYARNAFVKATQNLLASLKAAC